MRENNCNLFPNCKIQAQAQHTDVIISPLYIKKSLWNYSNQSLSYSDSTPHYHSQPKDIWGQRTCKFWHWGGDNNKHMKKQQTANINGFGFCSKDAVFKRLKSQHNNAVLSVKGDRDGIDVIGVGSDHVAFLSRLSTLVSPVNDNHFLMK